MVSENWSFDQVSEIGTGVGRGREPPGFPPVAVPAKGTDQSEGEGVEGGEGGQGWSDSHTFPPFSCHFLYRFRGHLCDLLALQRE